MSSLQFSKEVDVSTRPFCQAQLDSSLRVNFSPGTTLLRCSRQVSREVEQLEIGCIAQWAEHPSRSHPAPKNFTVSWRLASLGVLQKETRVMLRRESHACWKRGLLKKMVGTKNNKSNLSGADVRIPSWCCVSFTTGVAHRSRLMRVPLGCLTRQTQRKPPVGIYREINPIHDLW